MSRREYIQQNPDLENYAQFMHPLVAKRMGIKNKFIIFPYDFDPSLYSPYEIYCLKSRHNIAMEALDKGLFAAPYDHRFLNGKAWKLKKKNVSKRARRTLTRALQRNNTKSRLSRRVDARRKLRNSKHFKLWREHVRYKPSNSGYNAAKSNFYDTLDKMNDQELDELVALLLD
jgi:hypothetical protein